MNDEVSKQLAVRIFLEAMKRNLGPITVLQTAIEVAYEQGRKDGLALAAKKIE